jgi:hypothetical protein
MSCSTAKAGNKGKQGSRPLHGKSRLSENTGVCGRARRRFISVQDFGNMIHLGHSGGHLGNSGSHRRSPITSAWVCHSVVDCGDRRAFEVRARFARGLIYRQRTPRHASRHPGTRSAFNASMLISFSAVVIDNDRPCFAGLMAQNSLEAASDGLLNS